MKFSSKALLLAPLLVPFIYSALFVLASPGKKPFLAFLIFFLLGSFFSYCATIFLFLPCLYLFSRFLKLSTYLVGITGFLMGGISFIPFAWLSYRTSGEDSGPPEGTFAASLWMQLHDPFFWAFPIGGLITAMVYRYFCSKKKEL
jgi:hypothetical protein